MLILLPLALAIPLAQAPQAPALLESPTGWRTERIEFPLSFAPEIEWRGYEDLSFAPGMFVPGSDSYFSYAIAWRLEGEVALDEATLTRVLEAYYRGLYHAVAEGKNFTNDERTIHAVVRRDGERFLGSVSTFDPFTNGGAIALGLEISSHDSPRATEVLALASTLRADAPIWKQLHEIGRVWQATRPAPVYLNHVFAVVDRETYDAIAASKFLREEFAVTEQRTTKRADISYTGQYFYGMRTYFEFLPPESAAGLVAGNSGVGLGIEAAGGLDAFGKQLEQRGLSSQQAPVTRELAGEQLPWFRMLGIDMPTASFSLFAMEYQPQFLERWHADDAARPPLLARSAVLQRYATVLKRAALREGSLFKDIREVRLALDRAQREPLLAICAAAGYEIEKGADSWTVFGPQFRVLLRDSTGSTGVTAIELDLREPLEREALKLGRASVTFHGRTASILLER